MQADFYKAFEDKFRGSNDVVKNRLGAYRPVLDALKMDDNNELHCVDLGCGRGEWLEILKESGFQAIGFDLDSEMIRYCTARGLKVDQIDVISGLEKLPENSLCLITGFHIAEHLPFEVLAKLMREALRVLTPDGILILETPNPENILVGCQYFYLDPTHVRPIPMQLLGFLAQYSGFERVNTVRLTADNSSNHKGLLSVFTDVSPDYAIVAEKKSTPEKTAQIDHLVHHSGMSINKTTELYDLNIADELNELRTKINSVQIRAENADRKLAEYIQSRSIRFQIEKQIKRIKLKKEKLTIKKILKRVIKKPIKALLKLIIKNDIGRKILLYILPTRWEKRIRNNMMHDVAVDELRRDELSEYAVLIANELDCLRQK